MRHSKKYIVYLKLKFSLGPVFLFVKSHNTNDISFPFFFFIKKILAAHCELLEPADYTSQTTQATLKFFRFATVASSLESIAFVHPQKFTLPTV